LKINLKCQEISQIQLKFSGSEVEEWSFEVYETFSGGISS
jgi:hypothetical protein